MMKICVIILLIMSVSVFSNYLTGTVHKTNLHMQRKLLLNDVFGCSCGEQRMSSVSGNLKHLYQCLRKRIIHCDNVHHTSLEYIQLAQDKIQIYCTGIVVQGVDKSHRHRTIHIQMMKNFIIHFSLIMFNFEYFPHIYHGLSISEYISNRGRNTTYFTGRRLPWTMITTRNTASMNISTFAHLKFHLNVFYSAYKRNWFSHIQHVQFGHLGGSRASVVHNKLLESLKMTKSEIQTFSYHYIQKSFKRIAVSCEPIAEFKARIVIYDGPGRLSTRLWQSAFHNSTKRMIMKTSTFHVYIEVHILTDKLDDPLYINVHSNDKYLEYSLCNNTMNFFPSIYYSHQSTNTICIILFQNAPKSYGNFRPIFINQFNYEGPTAIMTGYGYINCQYGGVYLVSNENKFLCKSGSGFTLLNDADHSYILVAWLMGYSKGYIIARYVKHTCFYHHITDLRKTTMIDRIAFCQSYICSQPLSSKQQQCDFQLQIPDRPIGTATISTQVFKSIDECLPGSEMNPQIRKYNVSALYYNHSRLGSVKKLSISNEFGKPFKHTFQYLVSGNISLSLYCRVGQAIMRPNVKLKIATCRFDHDLSLPTTFLVNNIVGIEDECIPLQVAASSFNTIIYHENYTSNYSRNLILTSYDEKCPHMCKNHTFILKVYRKFSDRVDLYSAKIGETVTTDFSHQGFWLKINKPKKPCSFGNCDVWVSIFKRYLKEAIQPPSNMKYFDTIR